MHPVGSVWSFGAFGQADVDEEAIGVVMCYIT